MNRNRLLVAAMLTALNATAQTQDIQFEITGFTIEGNTLLPATEVNTVLSPFTGPGKQIKDVKQAADALRNLYENTGYPVVQVFPPEQTLSKGTVALKVLEGKINSISVKGNKLYSTNNVRASLPALKEDSKPNVKEIIAAIAAANENPAKQLTVNFQAAEKQGTIDAAITVTEDRPEKFTATIDNAGSTAVGVHRINLGYQNANLFNRDHMLTAQVGTSLDLPQKTASISGGYRIPFYSSGLSLDLIGAYSQSSANTNVGFGSTQFSGQGIMFGVRLNQALGSVGEFRHKLIYGLDYKDFDNVCKGTGAGKCGTVTSQPASLTYFAQFAKPEVQTSGSASLIINIPGGPNGDKPQYAAARIGAKTDWSAWRFAANLAVPLPQDWQFRSAISGQLTNERLIPGEQFGLGGATSVRGYTERVVTGDQGYNGNLEIYTPDFGKLLPGSSGLRALIFYDFGRIYQIKAINGERQQPLSSAGIGLRANLDRDVSAKLDVGFAQERITAAPGSGATRSRGDSFAHFAINLSF